MNSPEPKAIIGNKVIIRFAKATDWNNKSYDYDGVAQMIVRTAQYDKEVKMWIYSGTNSYKRRGQTMFYFNDAWICKNLTNGKSYE